jgi:RNA recognition motif-containing protein
MIILIFMDRFSSCSLFIFDSSTNLLVSFIIMSLVGSIFGTATTSQSSALSSLFEASLSLPERPHHQVVVAKKTKRQAPPNEHHQNQPQVSSADSKELQQQDDDDCTIFVGNLPPGTTRTGLEKLFSPCGAIASTRLRSLATLGTKVAEQHNAKLVQRACAHLNKIDPEAMVQGYVVFEKPESVAKALEMNAVEIQPGYHLRVDTATPTIDPARSVFVGNLAHHAADEASLRMHVAQVCDFTKEQILNIRLIRDKVTHDCKGFGYILLEHASLVPTALQRLQGSVYQKRALRVSVCGKRTKRQAGDTTREKKKKKDATGALQRILQKAPVARKRGAPTKHKTPNSKSSTSSRRQASEKKLQQRHKKLQKRAAKGMGKTKKQQT